MPASGRPPWRPPSARDLAALDRLVQAGSVTPLQRDEAIHTAYAWRVSLPDVLSAMYRVTSLRWARELSAASGLPLVDLRASPCDHTLLAEAEHDLYLRHLFIPWRRQPDGVVVIATLNPEDPAIRALMRERMPGCHVEFVITSKFDLIWAVQRIFDPELSEAAREALFNRNPELSAKVTLSAGQKTVAVGISLALLLALGLAPRLTLLGIMATVSALYASLFAFRGVLTIVGSGRRTDISVNASELAALKDGDLPVFTVLVPMYREAEVLPILVDSIRRLDYPRAKLDVKLVLEAGDTETIEAAKALGAEDLFEIIRVPDSQPKTKPKACNYALRFARGEYTVIFDAEDSPEPDQLRKVVALFNASGPEVACVQARLNYFNRDDNFLTRMFTLEYSQWFDYLLPGLYRLNIPIPLGGTSNHFRTEVLHELGAWDPYNVTEDADLGIRLTQAGYRVAVVNSTTFEEANGVLHSWINQRSRWIKGYMQTWLVHMRRPVELYRRLGPVGFLGFHMFIGFPPMTALINPLLWIMFLVSVIVGRSAVAGFFPGPVLVLALFDLMVGNAMYVYFNIVAVAKRRWYGLVPWGLLAPAYWVLHSVAAYKALLQLVTNPHYWEKTTHGTSSRTQETIASLKAGSATGSEAQ